MASFGHRKQVRLVGSLTVAQSLAVLGGVMVIVLIEAIVGLSFLGLVVCIVVVGGIDYFAFIGRRGTMPLGRWLVLRGAWMTRIPLKRWQPLMLPHKRTDRGIAPVFTPLGFSVVQVSDTLGVVEHQEESVVVASVRSSSMAAALAADATHGKALVDLWGRFLAQVANVRPITAISVTSLVAPLAPTDQAVQREAQRLINETWPFGQPATMDRQALLRMVSAAVSTSTWIGLHVNRQNRVDFTALARMVTELGQLHNIDVRVLSAGQIVWENIARVASPYDWADQMGQRLARVPSPQAIRPAYDSILIDDLVAARTGVIAEWPIAEVDDRWWLRLVTGLARLDVASVTTVHLHSVPPEVAQKELLRFGENAALQRTVAASRGKTFTPEQDTQHREVQRMVAEVTDGASLHWVSGGVTMVAPRTMSNVDFSARWRELRNIAATAGVTLAMPSGDALEAWRAFAFPFGAVRRSRG